MDHGGPSTAVTCGSSGGSRCTSGSKPGGSVPAHYVAPPWKQDTRGLHRTCYEGSGGASSREERGASGIAERPLLLLNTEKLQSFMKSDRSTYREMRM